MFIVYIPLSKQDKIPAVREFLDDQLLRNPNLNGAEYDVDTDIDATSAYLEGHRDEYLGTFLVRNINNLLEIF